MENKNNEQDLTADRRDVIQDGSSLSASTKRNNGATEKALHPEPHQEQERQGNVGAGVSPRHPNPDGEEVNPEPGQTQKQNQAGKKDDPLAA